MYCVSISTNGDLGGEWAFNPKQGGCQWQLWAALLSMLRVFGRLSPNGQANDPETHLTMADMRRLVLEGRYPEGWVRRTSGTGLDLINAARFNLKCNGNETTIP